MNLRFLLGFAAPYRVKLALAGLLMLAETGVKHVVLAGVPGTPYADREPSA